MASFSYENRRGSGKKLKVHFDLPEDEDYPIDHHKHPRSSISSESSLDSDNTNKDENFEDPNNIGYGSPVWSFRSGTAPYSPPLQLMSPNSGYDPNRIPTSIFCSKPTSPMEWSVASNESLFSLHLGNNSFSRDQVFSFNNKSGELPKTNDLIGASTTLPSVQEVNHNNDEEKDDKERHSLSSNSSRDSTNTLNETINLGLENDNIRTSNENADLSLKDGDDRNVETSVDVETSTLDKTCDDHSKIAVARSEEPENYTTSVSYRSAGSDMSNRSFQFPM